MLGQPEGSLNPAGFFHLILTYALLVPRNVQAEVISEYWNLLFQNFQILKATPWVLMK